MHSTTESDNREETLARYRFLQTYTVKSAPPHCHPISILVLILSGGFVMVGVIMTIVSHWPGSVSVGGDPLKIAGPVILAVSFLIFMAGIFLTCFLNYREKKSKSAKLLGYAQSSSKVNLNTSRRKQEEYGATQTGKNYLSDNEDTSFLPQKAIDSDKGFNDSNISYQDDNLDTLVPEPRRNQKKKKIADSSVEEFFQSAIDDEEIEDEIVTKTTTTTKVVKKKTKKKSNEVGDESNTSLKVKIKAKPGTSVNVSHV